MRKPFLFFSRFTLFSFIMINTITSHALDEIAHHKKVIGQTANFLINDDAKFLAHIDTGAHTTSVNAIDLEIEDEQENMRGNIGRIAHFTLVNSEGEEWRFSSPISNVVRVRNPQGLERRYKVPLRLGWNGINKTVDVNLRDRSKMEYKLLIGRDWLTKEVVIDPEKEGP